MAVALPLLTDGKTPAYSFSCELEGKTYSFAMLWNPRNGSWYMQIGDVAENLLAGSLRVVLGRCFIIRYRNAALPPGQFIAVDTSGAEDDPDLVSLGTRVQIWYYTSAELV